MIKILVQLSEPEQKRQMRNIGFVKKKSLFRPIRLHFGLTPTANLKVINFYLVLFCLFCFVFK